MDDEIGRERERIEWIVCPVKRRQKTVRTSISLFYRQQQVDVDGKWQLHYEWSMYTAYTGYNPWVPVSTRGTHCECGILIVFRRQRRRMQNSTHTRVAGRTTNSDQISG